MEDHVGKQSNGKEVKKSKDQKQVWGESKCRSCGGEDLTKLADLPSTPYQDVKDGRRYTTVLRKRVQCRTCESVTNLMHYEYDPSVWGQGE